MRKAALGKLPLSKLANATSSLCGHANTKEDRHPAPVSGTACFAAVLISCNANLQLRVCSHERASSTASAVLAPTASPCLRGLVHYLLLSNSYQFAGKKEQ